MTERPKWLDLAARRSIEHAWTFGAVLEQYCRIEGTTREEVAALLGCNLDSLAWLELCRRPSGDRFAEDVSTLSARFQIDPRNLARVVRRADAAAALQQPMIGRQDEEGMLLAARDREDKEGQDK